MSKIALYWDDIKKVAFDPYDLVLENWDRVNEITRTLSCVDQFYGTDRPNMRYGYFDEQGQWKHRPLTEFPSAFRAYLLIAGIP